MGGGGSVGGCQCELSWARFQSSEKVSDQNFLLFLDAPVNDATNAFGFA